MTISRTVGFLHQQEVSKSAVGVFNSLGIYRFCIAFAVIDYLDILDRLDGNDTISSLIKYGYAVIVLGFMAVYFLKWKKIDPTAAAIIFLSFFVVTGSLFAFNFFVYEERESYISAFIAPLVFSLAIFIPPNTIALDARKIIKDLTLVLAVGAVFYLVEAVIKPLNFVSNIVSLHEVQVHKSLICVLALCLSILTGRNALTLFLAVVTAVALVLRPMSTLVLALMCCLPIAIALRSRVLSPRPVPVLLSGAIAITTFLLAVSIPLLLYFFFDDIAAAIDVVETYLKTDIMGAQSNMKFRLAILKYAFADFDNTSFLVGSALSGKHAIPLAMLPGWGHWAFQGLNGEATIHSDFVIALVLMGIVGYILLSVAFYLVLSSGFRELGRRSLHGSGVVLQAISIVSVLSIIIYCSDEPYLSYYNHANVAWLLLLISQVARKSTIIERSDRRGRLTQPKWPLWGRAR